MSMWVISLAISVFIIQSLLGMHSQVVVGNPGLAMEFMFLILLIVVGLFFSFFAMFWTNYLVSKYNLNLFIDKITNPDFIGWLRFTRTKKFRPQIVSNGPLGQMKGVASGQKADIINDGSYTVTLPNGNQAVIKSDLVSTNINLDRAVGWNLLNKHFGVFGFKAWEKAAKDKKTVFPVEDIENEEEDEGGLSDGEIQFS